MKYGGIVPGKKSVPERIRDNRQPYYAGLQEADRAWNAGQYDLSALINYLEELLKAQLIDASAGN